jgi:hypothetical protein
MLPSDLLIYRQNGETVVPKKLTIDDRIITEASDRIFVLRYYSNKFLRFQSIILLSNVTLLLRH